MELLINIFGFPIYLAFAWLITSPYMANVIRKFFLWREFKMQDKLKELQDDVALENMDEFFLGAALIEITEGIIEDDIAPEQWDDVLERAEIALRYWRIKYREHIEELVADADTND